MSAGPGRWQRMLLEGLGEYGAIPASHYIADRLGRSLSPAECSAVSRAARALSRAGRAKRAPMWDVDYRGRRTHVSYLFSPDLEPDECGSVARMRRPAGRPKVERD